MAARVRAVACAAALLALDVAGAFKLTLLHLNDHHSHLAGERLTLGSDLLNFSEDVRVSYAGYPRIKTAITQLQTDAEAAGHAVLKLHAGDAITGTSYYSLFKGAADAEMMALVCFDAFALGNHEFDDGDAALATFLDHLGNHTAVCPNTSVLAANVVPGAGSPLVGKIAKRHTFEKSGTKIGVVGIDIKSKTLLASSPSHGTTLTDEKTAAQAEIDALIGAGVDKIVLLTHLGFGLDKEWMATLNGVDVVIGGDSHSLLGDANTTALGLNTEGSYPTEMTNGNSKKVCVVQAWEYTKAIGHLEVEFDAAGDVISCGGSPKFAYDAEAMEFGSGTALNTTQRDAVRTYLSALGGQWVAAAKDNTAVLKLANYETQVEALRREKIADVPEKICFDRFPGQGKGSCPPNTTQKHGGGACQLVAKAFLNVTKTAHIAIQNGGGCRTDIAAGNFTHDDAYTMLPFSNTLVELTLTGAQVKAVLESALDFGISPGGSTGAYPYAAGLRFAVNASQAYGSRFSRLQVNPRLTGAWSDINLATEYKLVTNSYIAGGKDGYTNFSGAVALDTYKEYAEGLVTYAKEAGTLEEPPMAEFSTQAYTDKDGVQHSSWTAEESSVTTAAPPGEENAEANGVASATPAAAPGLAALLALAATAGRLRGA